MARYQVTVRTSTVEIVEAENPYMAAVTAAERHGKDAEVTDVRPASNRTATAAPAKKKRQLSPEAKARLAQNLVKARAARAAKRKAATRAAGAKKTGTRKATAKKTATGKTAAKKAVKARTR